MRCAVCLSLAFLGGCQEENAPTVDSGVGGPAQGALSSTPFCPPPPAGHVCTGNSSGVLICFSAGRGLPPFPGPPFPFFLYNLHFQCSFSLCSGWVWGGLGGRTGVRWQLSFSTSEPPGRGDTALSLLLLSRLVMSKSLRPRGLQPARLLCPWDSPGKDTGAGWHARLQGIREF